MERADSRDSYKGGEVKILGNCFAFGMETLQEIDGMVANTLVAVNK